METPFDISELAGSLSDVAKTNAEFWNRQCSEMMSAPYGGGAAGEVVERRDDILSLPTPRALQMEKRARDMEEMDTQKGQHITGVSFIEGGQYALSRKQMPLEEDRPSKRVRSCQMEEASNAGQFVEQSTTHVEPQTKQKSRNDSRKEIEFLIGGLSSEAKAYQVKAFLDSHQMYEHVFSGILDIYS